MNSKKKAAMDGKGARERRKKKLSDETKVDKTKGSRKGKEAGVRVGVKKKTAKGL